MTVGANTLNLTDASGDYKGVISGTGGLTVTAGTETLSGVETYSGATTINDGSLALLGAGSIADSSGVTINGTGNLDITAASGTESIITLAGIAGSTVTLGANPLNLTDASGDYEGVISGPAGYSRPAPRRYRASRLIAARPRSTTVAWRCWGRARLPTPAG